MASGPAGQRGFPLRSCVSVFVSVSGQGIAVISWKTAARPAVNRTTVSLRKEKRARLFDSNEYECHPFPGARPGGTLASDPSGLPCRVA